MKTVLLKNNKMFMKQKGELIEQNEFDKLNTHPDILIYYLTNIQLATFNKAHLNSLKIIYESPIERTGRKNLKINGKNIFTSDAGSQPCKKVFLQLNN